MSNDACDKSQLIPVTEQPSQLCNQALHLAYSPADIPRAERDKADLAMLKVPSLTLTAADKGKDFANVMTVAEGVSYNSKTPQLTGAGRMVFDRLDAAGLHPSLESVNSSRYVGNHDWVIRANWKDDQNGNEGLHLRTEAALQHQKAEQSAAQLASFEAGMRAADALVLKAPGMAREAADRGADSIAIAKVADFYKWLSPNVNPAERNKQPQLSPDQQKIFDGLKAEGLSPSVESGDWSSGSHDSRQRAWVIKANWKDGENANPDLNRAMHAAQDRRSEQEAAAREQTRVDRQHGTDALIATIPALQKQAEINNKDAFGVMTLGTFLRDWHGSRSTETQPKLDEHQQRVFDELARRNLFPSIERVVPAPDSKSHSSDFGAWVLTAHRFRPVNGGT